MHRTAIHQRAFRRGAGVILLLAAAFAVIPSIASADEPLTRRVKISDLNLESPQGQQTLARRLRMAIDEVCAARDGATTQRFPRRQTEQCRQSARADAQRQLQQHGLSLLLASR